MNLDLVRKACAWGRKRVLDYGCGEQAMADALGPAYRVTGYDPGVPGLDAPPEPHPVVIVSDVLEHVESVPDVLRDVRRVTQQTALLFIATNDARPKDWWKRQIEDAGFHITESGDGVGPDGTTVGCFAECLPC